MAFHDVQFPTEIGLASQGGPEWSTEVVELGSGHERRNQNWEYSRERWNVAFGIKDDADLETVRDFFLCRAAKAHTFRFQSPKDYTAEGEDLGDGEGDNRNYQLVKNYTSGGVTYTRIITKPVAGTINIYVDGEEQDDTTYAVDIDTGMLTFDEALDSGAVVTADYQFDIKARFDTDFLPRDFTAIEYGSADIPILEVKS